MQPHTWVMLSARSATNAVDVWSGEGPPLTWATQRGWSAVTLRPGETVVVGDVSVEARGSRRTGETDSAGER